MQLEKYTEFSRRVNDRALRDRIPTSGTLELTHRCPLACEHCYNNVPVGDRSARQAELSYQEYCRLLDEITAAGCLWLLFTGGEVFARSDFLDIYTYAVKKGLLVSVFTSGTMITEAVANHLAEWRPFAIEITLLGATRATYEGVTRLPGSHERCLRGIDLLRERNLPLRLKTVCTRRNASEIDDMRQLVEKDLGLGTFKTDAMINARLDGKKGPLAERMAVDQVIREDRAIPARAAQYRRLAVYPGHGDSSKLRGDRLYFCGAGRTSFSVDPFGGMSMCVLSNRQQYDLRSGSFEEGWNHFLASLTRKNTTQRNKCTGCGLLSLCGTCPATSELEHGDPERPVDFFCKVAHLRAHVFGSPVMSHGDCEYCKGGRHYDALMRQIESITQSR